MARHFKYHSLADLEEDTRRLGLHLRFETDLRQLFEPVTVGNYKVGNAFCVQPMEGCDGSTAGAPDELVYRRYRRFGAGGAKLIWGEAAAVLDEGRANPRQLLLCEAHSAGFAKMLAECLQAHRDAHGDDGDLLVGIQLTHSGRYSFRKPMIASHDPLLDPRTVIDKSTRQTVDASYPILDDDYLHRLVDAYVQAAKLAHRIGFHFVDVKQCHGYLLNELLAARNRPGPFGGSFENRTRLAREIIRAIRIEVPGLMIASRINAFDAIPFQKRADDLGEPCMHESPRVCGWGNSLQNPLEPDLTEPLSWICEMIDLGVALINVTMGNPYASPHIIRPFEVPPPDGYHSPEHPLIGVDRHFRLTAAIQQAFPHSAIVGSGYSWLQEYLPQAGAGNVRDRRVSFVGVGRATLSQPDFVQQLAEHGKLDRRRICRTFSYCTALMRSKHNAEGQFATGCPPFDKETYGPIWKSAQLKTESES